MEVKIHTFNENGTKRIIKEDKTAPVTIAVINPRTKAPSVIHAEMVESRIAEVPTGYHKYSLRESDDGMYPATIEKEVIVNHYGDILVKEPLKFSDYLQTIYFSIR